ncbi:MAG: AAA-like domain-containing protein, partial [Chloroflexi bacterium]|nr:AAA-like domain-containing protein [Chloroflexota bacterium]
MVERSMYTVGGTVQAGSGLYVTRKADDELLALCRASDFAYILADRQIGKSSLMIRTKQQLDHEGIQSVIIDLEEIGVVKVSAEAWYLGLLAEIEEQLELKTDVTGWWQQHSYLSIAQRFASFFQQVLLAEISSPIVIFVDEIDSTLSLDFTDDFFTVIRALYDARSRMPQLRRLSFVLIGVATPGDLIQDATRTPFNIGQQVDLSDFTVEEALPFAKGLGLSPAKARQILDWVLAWTGGHPYLTQRLC